LCGDRGEDVELGGMRAEAIFVPVALLALWTVVVLFLMGFRRVGAVRAGQLRASAYKLGESADVPPEISIVNRHFMNLLEMPVLFYVVTLAFYVTRRVDTATVGMAWAYVLLRFGHSIIHLTSNRVVRRFYVFMVGNFVLLAMWIRFLAQVV
jgi:hypothetical protein